MTNFLWSSISLRSPPPASISYGGCTSWLGPEVTAQLVSAFIMSRVDYCKSVLAGLPLTTLEPLQRVQNAAAWLILNLNLHDHVKPPLKRLHWLPVVYRIQYKLCLIMHHVHLGTGPQYLTNAVQSVTSASRRSGLRSENTTKYVKRCTRTKFREWGVQLLRPSCLKYVARRLAVLFRH